MLCNFECSGRDEKHYIKTSPSTIRRTGHPSKISPRSDQDMFKGTRKKPKFTLSQQDKVHNSALEEDWTSRHQKVVAVYLDVACWVGETFHRSSQWLLQSKLNKYGLYLHSCNRPSISAQTQQLTNTVVEVRWACFAPTGPTFAPTLHSLS